MFFNNMPEERKFVMGRQIFTYTTYSTFSSDTADHIIQIIVNQLYFLLYFLTTNKPNSENTLYYLLGLLHT